MVPDTVPAKTYPLAVIFVLDTLASEDDPTVNTPVDVEKVKSALDVAVPAS